MTNSEGLTVRLPEPMADEIRTAVEAGEYVSASDAVADAVQLWSSHRHAGDFSTERLRQAWDAGKASGSHGSVDFNTLRHEARVLLAAMK